MNTHYISGRADFFAGRVPFAVDARSLRDTYDTLTNEQKARADGFFDARDDQRDAFAGLLPRSERPMPHWNAPPVDTDNDSMSMLTSEQARKRGLLRKGMSKAFRRKGRNAIIIHTNAAGTRIVWQGQVFLIDNLSVAEKEKVVANVFAAAYPNA